MNKLSALIIDDNPLNLELIAYLLKNNNYDVTTANNANEALTMLSQDCPQIILLDLQLPDMDGVDLMRKLRADKKYQDTLIIAITAKARKTDQEKAIEAGCDAYIIKPIDVYTLPDVIMMHFYKKKKNNS